TGTIKYNLHDRTESMCAATTDPKKTLFTIKLPLGSSFTELINMNVDLIEDAISQFLDLKVFKDKEMTIRKYAQCLSGNEDVRNIFAFDLYIFESDPQLIPENEYTFEFTADIAGVRDSLSDCFQKITALHPYFLQAYCDRFNWITGSNPFLREYEERKNPTHKQWNEFVASVFQLIYTIDGDIRIIRNFKELSDLCLNIDRNDEWTNTPLNVRLYIADKFFGFNRNPRADVLPAVTSIVGFNIKSKTKYIENIENKYSYFYEKRLPDSYSIKILKEIYKDCEVSLEEETVLNDFYNICFTSFMNMVKTETYIKRCANCGRYFIPLNRSDTLYCDSPAPQDSTKTCKKYGAEKQYQANLKNNETANRYRQTYMKLQMLVKRNPTIYEYERKYEEFKTVSKQWKLDVKNGVKSEEDYLKWINTY
ncbi:MAG: DUF6076 domain-containing protein, partial [Oscillospiraceae bacterium]|nr:DUF6076 domain-containing protein [Oscillospiraceae bacterium]